MRRVRHKFVKGRLSNKTICVRCRAYREEGRVYKRKEYVDTEGIKHSVSIVINPTFCDGV